MKLVLCLACVLFSTNATAGVFNWFFTEESPKIVRAKGTVANIALPLSHRIASKKFTWIPPSTALLLDDHFDSTSGKQLALSAHGIWLYVSKEDYVPNPKQDELKRTLITTKKIEVPLKDEPVSVLIPTGVQLTLQPNYDGRGPYLAQIDSTLISGLKTEKVYPVTINRNSGRIPKEVKGFEDIDFFTRAFIRETLTGYRASGCDSIVTIKDASAIEFESELSGGRDFGVISTEITLKASTSKQVTESITFPKGKKTHVFVYKKTVANRIYLFSEYESCVDDKKSYRIELVDFEEPAQVVINNKHPDNLQRDPRTQKLLITCHDEYDRISQFLGEDFPQDDVPFLISLIAEWKYYGDMTQCRH